LRLQTLEFAGGRAATEAAPLDLLCIAPHPDDAELGMGGALSREGARGRRAGVLDLSGGEMATNGTPEARLRESAEAAVMLGLRWRGNLGLPDRALEERQHVVEVVGALRLLRPELLFVPFPEDPHPDHAAACRLALEAAFSAGLRRFAGPEWAAGAPPHRPRCILQYFINGWRDPPIALDVSAFYDAKRRSIAAHVSQFARAGGAEPGGRTRLNSGAAQAQVEARDRFLGAQLGVVFAEGFIPARPLLVRDMEGFLGGTRE
jgi:bacillithiol biosynthesis deacetylase BshB1